MIFSFVVDTDPRFASQGLHLALSIEEHCGGRFDTINVHFTREVPSSTRRIFEKLGCQLHQIERFGDGKYCNKIVQLENLKDRDFECAILLDTDTIVVADFRDAISVNAIQGKVVDLANPSLDTLRDIAETVGMANLPPVISTDARDGMTFLGNCNGGFYVVPKPMINRLSMEWRYWATWLLRNSELLRKSGKEAHIDQVSMWLSIHMGQLPYMLAPSNFNYYVHFLSQHLYFDPKRPISLIHYHHISLDTHGLINSDVELEEPERWAISRAKAQIERYSRWFK